jgi:CIC family chloride channel protein
VVDADRQVLGIVDPPAVLRWRRAGKHRRTTLRELLSDNRPVTAYPDDYLDGIIEHMSRANVAHVPVIAREDGRLVGYIGWQDLMKVRRRLEVEERERVVFYRVR